MEQAFKNSSTRSVVEVLKPLIPSSLALARSMPPEITSIQLVARRIIYSDRLKQHDSFLTIGGSRLNLRKLSSPLVVRSIQAPEQCLLPDKPV